MTTGYEHTNSKGKKYYLHSKGRLFFFSKEKDGSISIPQGYHAVESEKTGLPMLKKN